MKKKKTKLKRKHYSSHNEFQRVKKKTCREKNKCMYNIKSKTAQYTKASPVQHNIDQVGTHLFGHLFTCVQQIWCLFKFNCSRSCFFNYFDCSCCLLLITTNILNMIFIPFSKWDTHIHTYNEFSNIQFHLI